LDRRSGGQNESKDTDSKLTATERIMRLVDTHSFVETQALAEYSAAADGLKQVSEPGEGVVTGFGTIDGRGVYVFSQDYTVLGGSVGYMHARKIIKLLDMAGKTGLPVIGLLDSMGARIGEGSAVMESFGKIIAKLSELSGVVPVITAICGQCSGTAAYFAPLSDFVFMTENISGIYTAAPGAYNKPGQPADTQTAGGAAMHARQTGLAHFLCPNENDLFCYIRQILSYLPDNNLSEAPVFECADDLNRRLEDFRKPYDMRDVVSSVLDGGDFFESQACYAPAVITGFGRINGKSIGVIANSSGLHINGESCSKAAGFISFCDAFGIPIVTFSDTPGFEKNAFNIKSGANLMRAYSEATVPLVTVITGDAIGAGYIAMASKALGADMVFAWPDAVISCLPADAASIIVLSDAFPETDSPSDARKQAAERYAKTFASPWEAAKLGYVDEVIYPSETRQRVAGALEFAAGKRESKLPKKHGTRLY
ncbi:MAG: carboxyl transferase domain-containing protein, partial [Christensenellales bacterium]